MLFVAYAYDNIILYFLMTCQEIYIRICKIEAHGFLFAGRYY